MGGIWITLTAGFVALYEWSIINRKQKKERIVCLFLLSMGWTLAMVLLFYPNLSGPTQWLNALFEPLGKMLGI